VTAHPTAAWTLQQLREAFPSEHEYRFLIHDRDSIFSKALDNSIRNLRLRVLKTPYRTPQANALCERFIGTLRREFLDWMIPLSENHLRLLLRSWVAHYNGGRPHMSLGPGVPDPPSATLARLQSAPKHWLADGFHVTSHAILGGLHHEYCATPHPT
jgi:transposase InsO family protein